MKLLKELLPYIIILVVVIVVRTFIVTPIKVNGSSMYNTLDGKEIMLLWKVGSINRYDIVVADTKDDSLIKRVYGLPGETISCKDNKIYVNGKEIDNHNAFGETEDFSEVKLSEDEYFIMGDNRLVSMDSRRIGPVNRKNIEGTANIIIFPFSKFGTVKD